MAVSLIPETFNALLVEQTHQHFAHHVAQVPLQTLPAGEVLVRVHYSSLNYKDALSATGHPGVSKKFPHIPGVDAAGIVVSSEVAQFQPGDAVVVSGFDLGMNTWGGFADYLRVPAAWVMPLPQGLSLQESMIYGTAGLTAALSVEALLRHQVQPGGEVLVTGATGGVGSFAVAILAKLGYSVVAVTGKLNQHDYLLSLGAAAIVSREEVGDRTSDKPLLKGRWAGVIDTVGGDLLANAIKTTRYGGCITACGLVGGADLVTTVYPFILRGISLIGIDSVNCPMATRLLLWQKLAGEWKVADLGAIATTVSLSQLPQQIAAILNGQIVGRVVVAVNPAES